MALHKNDMITIQRWKWEAINEQARRYPIVMSVMAISCLCIGLAVGVLSKSC